MHSSIIGKKKRHRKGNKNGVKTHVQLCKYQGGRGGGGSVCPRWPGPAQASDPTLRVPSLGGKKAVDMSHTALLVGSVATFSPFHVLFTVGDVILLRAVRFLFSEAAATRSHAGNMAQT